MLLGEFLVLPYEVVMIFLYGHGRRVPMTFEITSIDKTRIIESENNHLQSNKSVHIGGLEKLGLEKNS